MTIQYISDGSSILDSPANILANPVNCQPGVLGAGLAKAFADRWPGLREAHRKAVLNGMLSPGHGHLVWMMGDPNRPDPFGVYLLPTKDHWREPSRLEWVADGLDVLGCHVDRVAHQQWGERRVKAVTIPALGTGLGGLAWAAVRPLIERICVERPEVEWLIYPPKGAKS